MRLLRTEFYFHDITDPEGKRGHHLEVSEGSSGHRLEKVVSGTFSIAWFSTHTNRLISLQQHVKEFDPYAVIPMAYLLDMPEVQERKDQYVHQVVGKFIDLSLGDSVRADYTNLLRSEFDAGADPSAFSQSKAAELIFSESIIIERSPAEAIPLKIILAKTGYIALGSFVGMQVAASNPWLMFVSIPGGIIAMGAAVGLSNGLANGLPLLIQRWINSPAESDETREPRAPKTRGKSPNVYGRGKRAQKPSN